MSNILSPYWEPIHKDDEDEQIMRAWQPPVLKLSQNWWTNPHFMERWMVELPNTRFAIRNIPLLSGVDDAIKANPVALGEQHARYYLEALRLLASHDPEGKWFRGLAAFICLSANEPGVARYNIAGKPEAGRLPSPTPEENTALYNAAFANVLTNEGATGGLGNLSVGWPDNDGKDTPVNWEHLEPMHEAAVKGDHHIVTHEYWSPSGEMAWGWWADRIGQCPWTDVKIGIGETGIDAGVVGLDLWGWQRTDYGHIRFDITKESYLGQIESFIMRLAVDGRVEWVTPFLYDFDYAGDDTNRWATFDVRPIRHELLAMVHRLKSTPVPAALPIPRYPAGVILPQPEPKPEPEPEPADDKMIRVLMPNGTVQRMAVEEYLRGVCAA